MVFRLEARCWRRNLIHILHAKWSAISINVVYVGLNSQALWMELSSVVNRMHTAQNSRKRESKFLEKAPSFAWSECQRNLEICHQVEWPRNVERFVKNSNIFCCNKVVSLLNPSNLMFFNLGVRTPKILQRLSCGVVATWERKMLKTRGPPGKGVGTWCTPLGTRSLCPSPAQVFSICDIMEKL